MDDTKRIISKTILEDVADAIREKKGTNSLYSPSEFAQEISTIETGGGGIDDLEPYKLYYVDYDNEDPENPQKQITQLEDSCLYWTESWLMSEYILQGGTDYPVTADGDDGNIYSTYSNGIDTTPVHAGDILYYIGGSSSGCINYGLIDGDDSSGFHDNTAYLYTGSGLVTIGTFEPNNTYYYHDDEMRVICTEELVHDGIYEYDDYGSGLTKIGENLYNDYIYFYNNDQLELMYENPFEVGYLYYTTGSYYTSASLDVGDIGFWGDEYNGVREIYTHSLPTTQGDTTTVTINGYNYTITCDGPVE